MTAWRRLLEPFIRTARTVTQARLWGLAFILASFATFLSGLAALVWIFVAADAEGYFPLIELLLLGLPILLIFGCSAGCLKICDFFRQRMHDLQAQDLWAHLESENLTIPKYVLYLRPFDSTGEVTESAETESRMAFDDRYRTHRDFELESQLADATRDFCAFVGLGKSLEHIGAGRIEVDDASWKYAILKLMSNARLIIMVPVINPGTLWELDQVIENSWVSKTLFINVPERNRFLWIGPKFVQSDDWPVIQERLARAGFRLPEFSKGGGSVFFGAHPNKPRKRRISIADRNQLKRVIKSTRTLN